jgi:hypothetical protein
MTAKNNLEDLWKQVMKRGKDECWPWMGRIDKDGYGVWDWNNRSARAHRLAFFSANNILLETGVEILHSCHNNACCNPKHLSRGTHIQAVRPSIRQFSKEEVEYMRNCDLSCSYLALKFNCSPSTVSRIRRGIWAGLR